MDRKRELHAQHKDPKRFELREAFRPHDARDDAEDGKRHGRDDPVQNLNQRFQEELNEVSNRSKRPCAFLAERHPKCHGDEDDSDDFPIIAQRSEQALGHILKKGGKRVGCLRRFVVWRWRGKPRALSWLNHIGDGKANEDCDQRIQQQQLWEPRREWTAKMRRHERVHDCRKN